MKNIYDENNPDTHEEQENSNEFDGFRVGDANEGDKGLEENTSPNNKPAKENEGEEMPEGSIIPDNEQTVMIDNHSVSSLAIGTPLEIKIKNANSISVYNGTKKVGDFKPAFSEKLLATRKNQHAECSLHAKDGLVLVKLKYHPRARKGTVKLALPV